MITPAKGQQFWMLNSRFEVKSTQNNGSEKSRQRIVSGNWFRTQKEAEAFREYVLKGATNQAPKITKIPVTDMSAEAIDMHYASLLLNNSMNHSSEIIKYASMVVAAGPARKQHQLRKIVDDFKGIRKAFGDREKQIIAEFAKVAANGR